MDGNRFEGDEKMTGPYSNIQIKDPAASSTASRNTLLTTACISTESENRGSPTQITSDSDDGCDRARQIDDKTITVPSKKKLKKGDVRKYSWHPEVVDAVIREWEGAPLLFNVSHPHYYLTEKRKEALQSIRNNLSKYEPKIEPLPSVDDILKKINSLRVYYNSERNKIEFSKTIGRGARDVYKSRWKYFDHLQFLNDNVTPRTFHSNFKERDSIGKTAYSPSQVKKAKASSSAEELSEPYVKRPREFSSSELNTKSPGCSSEPSTKSPDRSSEPSTKSPGQLFGEMVAQTFDEIPNGYQRDMMKIEIMKLMYDVKYRVTNARYDTPLEEEAIKWNQMPRQSRQHFTQSSPQYIEVTNLPRTQREAARMVHNQRVSPQFNSTGVPSP